jgi:hypothetical protein
MKVDLSIIIVNYNTKDLTISCIKSVQEHTKGLNYEIILVDNASDDGSIEEIKKLGVKIIQNAKNFGFSKANNQGIKIARGDTILLLNSDTEIHNNAIGLASEKLKKADILTVKIKSENGENQQAGGYGPNLFNLFCWAFFIDDIHFLYKLIKPYQISYLNFFDQDRQVDWVIGAFFMMKKAVIEKIGALDENIFMYGEEMEYCRRARNAGFKIRYYSKPEIIHYGMGSSESGEGAIIGEYKALKYFFRKFQPSWQNYILNFILRSSILLRIMLYNFKGSSKAKIYAKAFKNI